MRWRIQITREDDNGLVELTSTQIISEAEVKKIQSLGGSVIELIKSKAAAAFYNIINWSAEAIR